MKSTIYNMDCRDAMSLFIEPNSVDSIVTDPPYGLSEHKTGEVKDCLRAWLNDEAYEPKGAGFMGKKWDAWIPGPEVWKEAFTVLKPGGHMLVFAGTRSMDLMMMAIRLAGFELRDAIGYAHDGGGAPLSAWTYGSGFPKSLDVSKAIDKAAGAERGTAYVAHGKNKVFGEGKGKAAGVDRTPGANFSDPAVTDAAQQWQGWGTALKPAWEPVIIARKPLIGTVAANVLHWGTGGLNIDACRVNPGEIVPGGGRSVRGNGGVFGDGIAPESAASHDLGRWPANLIHDGSPEVLAAFPQAPGQLANDSRTAPSEKTSGIYGVMKRRGEPSQDDANEGAVGFKMKPGARRLDAGSAARFFMQCKQNENDIWQDLNLPQESASIADSTSSPQRRAVVSALDLAVNTVLPEGRRCITLCPEPFTSATASELRQIADTVTQTILSFEQGFWFGSQPEKLSLTRNHVSVAVCMVPTGTTTITANLSKSDGSAVSITFNITQSNLAPGAKDSAQSSANRLIYCAKASKKDRNEGLYCHETVIIEWSSTAESPKWDNADQRVVLQVDTEPSRPRVIGVSGASNRDASEWSMLLFGNEHTAPCLQASTCIIETLSNSTTGLTTLSYFQNLLTSANTQVANCEMVSGGNLAQTAAPGTLLLRTTSESMASALGVAPAVSPTLLKISASARRSDHPTVKPTDLMAYLCRLVTPPGGTVLDPFSGSGSTGKAAVREGFNFIGCELDADYVAIAEARIAAELAKAVA